MKASVVPLWLVLAGASAGCFSDKDGPAGPIEGECRVPVSVIEAADVVIAIRDFSFKPDSVRVAPGAVVAWVNCEPEFVEAHTSTSDDDVWSSPLLEPGAVFTRTFDRRGVFPYHCVPHPFMRAKVVVE
jgi:plastocyanin